MRSVKNNTNNLARFFDRGKSLLPDILVDADACPVKQEIYRVAKRYGLKVILVANSPISIPQEAELVW